MKLFNATWRDSGSRDRDLWHVSRARDTGHWPSSLANNVAPDHCSRSSSTLPPNLLHYSSGKFPQWSWQHYINVMHYQYCTVYCGVTRGGIRRITKRLILRLFTHMSINPPSLRVNQNETWDSAKSLECKLFMTFRFWFHNTLSMYLWVTLF